VKETVKQQNLFDLLLLARGAGKRPTFDQLHAKKGAKKSTTTSYDHSHENNLDFSIRKGRVHQKTADLKSERHIDSTCRVIMWESEAPAELAPHWFGRSLPLPRKANPPLA
jgi:hypothetical protein